MSTSSTSSFTLERERLRAAVRAALGAASSEQLRRLALPERGTVMDAGGVLSSLEARTTAAGADRGVARALAIATPGMLATCTALVQRSQKAMRQGRASAARNLALEGDRVFRQGLLRAANAAARQERVVTGSLVSEALIHLGCTTTVFTGDKKTGIWAERGHQMVAVLIQDGAKAEIDIAGCTGGECTPLHHELEIQLARVGVRLMNVVRNDHRDERGGTLIQRAAAVPDKSDMAEGIVKARRSRFMTPATKIQAPLMETS